MLYWKAWDSAGRGGEFVTSLEGLAVCKVVTCRWKVLIQHQ